MNKTFIDMFAGIGGFHQAAKKQGLTCVFANDQDKFCCETYRANHGPITKKDIMELEDVPRADILFGGFPCQPFSRAALRQGFDDEKRGHMFLELLRILKKASPQVVFLENVKNIETHDRGKTMHFICSQLKVRGYKVYSKVVNSEDYVPQKRERMFIVGIANTEWAKKIQFSFPEKPKKRLYEFKDVLEDVVPDKYTISDKLWGFLQRHKENHAKKGNGFGYGLVNKDTPYTRTLTARYGKDGSEILLAQEGKNPRRLTPRECARLMGFPDSFKIPVSDTQAYKQFGNSVVVPAVEDTLKNIIEAINNPVDAPIKWQYS